MIKNNDSNDSQKRAFNDSTIPERFHSVLGSVFTVLDVIKKTHKYTHTSTEGKESTYCFVWEKATGRTPAWKCGIVPFFNESLDDLPLENK